MPNFICPEEKNTSKKTMFEKEKFLVNTIYSFSNNISYPNTIKKKKNSESHFDGWVQYNSKRLYFVQALRIE